MGAKNMKAIETLSGRELETERQKVIKEIRRVKRTYEERLTTLENLEIALFAEQVMRKER